VTENGVTVTANASEEEIRTSAGFTAASEPAASEPDAPVVGQSLPADSHGDAPAPTAPEANDRNPDGTFKAKPKDPAGDPRKSFQAKINEERRLRGDAERRAAELEARLQASAPERQPSGESAPPRSQTYLDVLKEAQRDPEWPRLEQFIEAGVDDPYAAMTAAQGAFLYERRAAARDAEAAQAREIESHRQQVMSVHQAGAEKYADWGDLFATDAAQMNLQPAVLAELYADPSSSADVIHYLLTHPDELEVLAGVANDPVAAARAVTALTIGATSASPGPEAPPVPKTRAKPLIKPVSASPAAPDVKSIDDLPFGPRYVKETAKREREWRDAHRGV